MGHGYDGLRVIEHGQLHDSMVTASAKRMKIEHTMGVNSTRDTVCNFDIEFRNDIFYNVQIQESNQ